MFHGINCIPCDNDCIAIESVVLSGKGAGSLDERYLDEQPDNDSNIDSDIILNILFFMLQFRCFVIGITLSALRFRATVSFCLK